MIRTRFAPSPTGELHIGSARTALFAYLFAKRNGGEFLLRIEDTDRARLVEGSAERMIESLKWLNIVPENLNNIVVQSKRTDIYLKYALELVKNGKAYVCECSKERLEKLREEQERKKLPPQYDRHCRDLNLEYKEGFVIRFKMPLSGEIVFSDPILGEIKFDAALQDDAVLIKSDGFPTYHLAAIVDDHEMKISHVIRGVEWLASTPKHIALYEAFGWEPPLFAHLPVILGPDHKHKLSKRDGDVSVIDFKTKGYLPEALINFIVLLGWNPKTEREIFSLDELVSEFKLENVNKSPAVFDINKLNDISEKYIKEQVENEKLKVKSIFKKEFELEVSDGELALVGRGGFVTLKDAADYILKLRQDPEYEGKMLIFKKSTEEATLKGLQAAEAELQTIDDWKVQELQMQLSLVVSRNNLTNGDVFWPVRVALSGEERSPSPVELAIALGKKETLKRIEKAIKKLI